MSPDVWTSLEETRYVSVVGIARLHPRVTRLALERVWRACPFAFESDLYSLEDVEHLAGRS